MKLVSAALGAQSRNKFYKMDCNKCYTYVHASREMTDHLMRQTKFALPMFAKTPAYFYLYFYFILLYKSQFRASIGRALIGAA